MKTIKNAATVAAITHVALANGKNACGASGEAAPTAKEATCPECQKVLSHIAAKAKADSKGNAATEHAKAVKATAKRLAEETMAKAAKKGKKGSKKAEAKAEPSKVEKALNGDGKRALLYSETIKLVKKECPHREASAVAMKSWNALLKSKTVGDFKENGGDLGYLRWYVTNGIVEQKAAK